MWSSRRSYSRRCVGGSGAAVATGRRAGGDRRGRARGAGVVRAIVTAAVVIPPLPSVPLDVAAGSAFGFWLGSALTLTGDVVGATIAFSLAWRFGGRWVESRVARGHAPGVAALAEGLSPRALAGVRLIPTFSFELVSYAAGLSSMSLGAFVVATVAGVTLPVMALVGVGDAIVEHERHGLGGIRRAAGSHGGAAAVVVFREAAGAILSRSVPVHVPALDLEVDTGRAKVVRGTKGLITHASKQLGRPFIHWHQGTNVFARAADVPRRRGRPPKIQPSRTPDLPPRSSRRSTPTGAPSMLGGSRCGCPRPAGHGCVRFQSAQR